jgi:hypothetical protein
MTPCIGTPIRFITIGHFLGRKFFLQNSICPTPMAAIDWDAAITALQAGELFCSGGERRILLLSASLAAGTPVGLGDTVTGIDDANISRLLTAIRHAAGKRP